MTLRVIKLTNENAGAVVSFLRSHGQTAELRNPAGGSVGALVVTTRDGAELVIRPGDRVRIVGGDVSLF